MGAFGIVIAAATGELCPRRGGLSGKKSSMGTNAAMQEIGELSADSAGLSLSCGSAKSSGKNGYVNVCIDSSVNEPDMHATYEIATIAARLEITICDFGCTSPLWRDGTRNSPAIVTNKAM